MRVLYLNYDFHPSLFSPSELLAEYRGMTSWCSALKGAAEVSALQRHSEDAEETRDGIRYRFAADGLPPRPGWLHNPVKVHRIAALENPDVVHLNGKPLFARSLRAHLPGHVAIVWQNHASTIPRRTVRWLYRAAGRSLDGMIFSHEHMAQSWKAALNGRFSAAFSIAPEATLSWEPVDYAAARRQLNLGPEPVVLWVGRLVQSKDPLTVITGFARVVRRQSAVLLMAYQDKTMEGQVRESIQSLGISDRVRLLGKVEHDRLRLFYSAADVFVSASLQEGDSYSLMEALSCGATPVVSSIPSFLSSTHNGRAGFFWAPGDAASCADALARALQGLWDRKAIRAVFAERYGPSVVREKAISIYRDAVTRRRHRPGGRG